MDKDLRKELETRGTAEVPEDGIVTQVTQALDETETKVKYLIFGKLKEQGIISIEQACAQCDFWKGKFTRVQLCQKFQSKDAQLRGFNKLICPKQFVD